MDRGEVMEERTDSDISLPQKLVDNMILYNTLDFKLTTAAIHEDTNTF